MGFYSWQLYYNKTHKATQTMKDTLHTRNTTHTKKSKANPVTGCGGL
jgi:hypothetical protein